MATPLAVVLRSSEDVHPPGYYLAVWAAAQSTSLDFVTASRGFSALLAVLALLFIIIAPPRSVGWSARLGAAAFAASSAIWFEYSQQARSYALCFVLVAALIGIALRCRDRLRLSELPIRWLTILAFVALLTCLSHYYALLLAGAVFSMLLVYCQNWRAVFAVCSAGISVLIGTLTYLGWHVSRMVADIGDTWFSSDFAFVANQLQDGLSLVVEGIWSTLFVGFVVVALISVTMRRRHLPPDENLEFQEHWGPVTFLAGVFGLTIVFSVLTTLAVTPNLSFRLLVLMAPVCWIALAYGLEVVLRGQLPWAATLLSVILVGASSVVLNRGVDDQQNWRQSAQTVAATPGCLSATLPVMWWEQPYFGADDPEYFYGFYLPSNPGRDWITVPRDDAAATLSDIAIGDLVNDTARGARQCSIVLWSVHLHGTTSSKMMQEHLQSHLPANSDHKIEVEIL